MDHSTKTKEELEQRFRMLSAAVDSAKRERNQLAARSSRTYSRHSVYPYSYGTRSRYSADGTPPFRNRSLVIQQAPSSGEASDGSTDTQSEAWVQKRDRHLQLINKTVYDKRADGSQNTPVASRPPASTYGRRVPTNQPHGRAHMSPKSTSAFAKTELCPTYCTTGECRKGPSCRYLHDPNSVAMCKEFLFKGTCRNGSCYLSHEPTSNRVPACMHFLRGNCNNAQCRYAHVNVSASAPVCQSFARLGFCKKGLSCLDRHEFECPEYSSSGTCSNPRCRLPHVDRASRPRQEKAPDKANPQLEIVNPLDMLDEALQTPVLPDVPSTATASSAGTFREQENFVSLDVDPDGQYEQMFMTE